MEPPAQELSGTLLNRVETGENHLRLMIFSPVMGLQAVLFRKSRKRGLAPFPDLFDDLECSLQNRGSSGLPFVSEHRLLLKRSELAIDHKRFFAASQVAKFYLDNGSHLLESEFFFELLSSSLSALARGGNEKIVRFKTFYVFAKEEGLPVKQSWYQRLSTIEKSCVRKVLRETVDQQNVCDPGLDKLLLSLMNWLSMETELIF